MSRGVIGNTSGFGSEIGESCSSETTKNSLVYNIYNNKLHSPNGLMHSSSSGFITIDELIIENYKYVLEPSAPI